MTRRERLGLLVGLKRLNDLDLIEGNALFKEAGFLPREREAVTRVSGIIHVLYDDFDYTKSPEFLRSTEGKSEGFRAMKVRLLTSEKRAEALRRFSEALEGILDSEEARDLVPASQLPKLDELKRVVL